jgi:acetamidase/formamidase
MQRILRGDYEYKFHFSKDHEPVARIEPGETLMMQTEDSYCGKVKSEADAPTLDVIAEKYDLNPLCGPIYVKGAEPGDNIVVTIDDIVAGGPDMQGVFCIEKTHGLLDSSLFSLQEPIGPYATVCKFENGYVVLPMSGSKPLKIPMEPIIGVIGVAPARDRMKSYYHSSDVCGNVDSPDMKKGTKLTLPVNVPGAYFYVGDCAGMTGDGEIIAHPDCAADVTLTIDLVKKGRATYISCPQVETVEHIGSIGCELGVSLADTIRMASKDMLLRLNRHYGMELLSAYRFLTLDIEILVNHVFFTPTGGCSTVKVHKSYLEQFLGRTR